MSSFNPRKEHSSLNLPDSQGQARDATLQPQAKDQIGWSAVSRGNEDKILDPWN